MRKHALGKCALSAASHSARQRRRVTFKDDCGLALMHQACDKRRSRGGGGGVVDLRKPPRPPTLSTFFICLCRLSLSSWARALEEEKKEKRREEKKSQPFDIIFSINNTFSTAPPSRRGSSINKAARRTLYRAGGAHAKKKEKKKKEERERETAGGEHFYENSLFVFVCVSCSQTDTAVGRPPVPIQAAVNIKGAASVVFQLIACLPPPPFSPPLYLPPPPSVFLAGSQHAGGVEPEAVHLLQAGGAGHNDGRRRSRHRQDLPDPKHITSHSTP